MDAQNLMQWLNDNYSVTEVREVVTDEYMYRVSYVRNGVKGEWKINYKDLLDFAELRGMLDIEYALFHFLTDNDIK
jgi:hypothetical protein